ncbi:MAG: AmmeMemoRadiSam system protein B [Nannocystaceae bacterium]|nr:AmmeMemoRadiSam system protein B [Nannocystaceae bacterium]
MNAAPRHPAVAGRFYPDRPELLARELAACIPAHEPAAPALMLMGPHAGWMYSGAIAGLTWARTAVPRRVILLAPNHTGVGPSISLWSGGPWLLPGGDLAIDEPLRDAIAEIDGVTLDASAHAREHAIEVHLPMLRARRPDARIVPLVLSRLAAPQCAALGRALAQAIARCGDEVLVVASTDMSHYVPVAVADALDHSALDRVLALDPDGLHHTVEREHISMCGYVPTAVALHCARARGAHTAALVRYGHSGETSGDLRRVVGYAGVLVA